MRKVGLRDAAVWLGLGMLLRDREAVHAGLPKKLSEMPADFRVVQKFPDRSTPLSDIVLEFDVSGVVD